MTSRSTLVERIDPEKYFLNLFYQLEVFSPSLNLEYESIELEEIKLKLFEVISRDKKKYENKQKPIQKKKSSTIYEKLDWFEKYINTKHNRLKSDIVGEAFSTVFRNLR